MTIYPGKQESGFIAEDNILPITWSPAEMVSSATHKRLSMSLQQYKFFQRSAGEVTCMD